FQSRTAYLTTVKNWHNVRAIRRGHYCQHEIVDGDNWRFEGRHVAHAGKTMLALFDCFKATRSESASLAQAVAELETRLGQAIERPVRGAAPEVDARLAEYPKIGLILKCYRRSFPSSIINRLSHFPKGAGAAAAAPRLVHQAMSVISDIQWPHGQACSRGTKEGRYLDCIDEVVALSTRCFVAIYNLLKRIFRFSHPATQSIYNVQAQSARRLLSMWSNNFVFKEPLERPLICSLTVRNLANAPKLVRAFQALKLFHSKVDAQLADTLLSASYCQIGAAADAGQEQQAADGEADVENDAAATIGSVRACLSPTLDTLREFLLSLPLSDTSEEQQQQSQSDQQPAAMTTLADRLRPLMENQLAERLITDCLAKTVPTDWAGLQAYGETAAAVERLEHQLVVECRLVSANVSRLGEFVREIGVVFAEKRIAAILEAGREIAARAHICFPNLSVSQSAIDLVNILARFAGKHRQPLETESATRATEQQEEKAQLTASSSPSFAVALASAAGNFLLLYRDTASLIMFTAEQLASVPQLARSICRPASIRPSSNPPAKIVVVVDRGSRSGAQKRPPRIFLAQLARPARSHPGSVGQSS
uniref:Ras-GAP domain-containing protein n=1 Tax=Macrostomum lignano TaxID=282301 RepID=A0A1I8JQ65_9PLAT